MNRAFTIFSLALLALAALWIALSSAAPADVTGGQIPAPRAGFAAPDFELTDAQGNITRLADLRGQGVVLNFWASWCPPCQAEMPAMQKVYDAYRDRGFVVLAVNATHQDDQTRALQFAAERSLTFPILLDESGAVNMRYEVRSLPTTFFINADGIIEEVVVGGPMSEALLQTQAERLKGAP